MIKSEIDPPLYFPKDGPLRWEIPSSSEHDSIYLVDLGANGGIGVCQCNHWLYHAETAIKRGERPTCRHIVEARRRFTDWAIYEFHKFDPNLPEDAQP